MQLLEVGLLPDPGQHFKAVFARHVQVEQYSGGHRKLIAVAVGADSAKVGDRFLAPAGDLK